MGAFPILVDEYSWREEWVFQSINKYYQVMRRKCRQDPHGFYLHVTLSYLYSLVVWYSERLPGPRPVDRQVILSLCEVMTVPRPHILHGATSWIKGGHRICSILLSWKHRKTYRAHHCFMISYTVGGWLPWWHYTDLSWNNWMMPLSRMKCEFGSAKDFTW